MTTRLNQGLLAVEDAVLAMKVLPVAEANTAARDAVVKQLCHTALDGGGTVTQMRMALERGAAVADKVFSPTAGYEGLSAEQVKILKELDKEREKEEQEKTKQQTLQESQTGGGRGGYYRPYNRGQGFYLTTTRTSSMVPRAEVEPGSKAMQRREGSRANSNSSSSRSTASRSPCLSRTSLARCISPWCRPRCSSRTPQGPSSPSIGRLASS